MMRLLLALALTFSGSGALAEAFSPGPRKAVALTRCRGGAGRTAYHHTNQ